MNLPKQAEEAVRKTVPDSLIDKADIDFDDTNGEVKIQLYYNFEILPEQDPVPGKKIAILLDNQPIKEEY